jgi:hypothetical protein
MRVKCKLCNNFVNGICLIFGRKRSSGKKRWCEYFDKKKVVKKSVAVVRVPWMSKADKKKEFLRKRIKTEKLLEKAKGLEQQEIVKVKAAEKIITKKPNIFKRLFRKIVS